jgi:hypothetical protein
MQMDQPTFFTFTLANFHINTTRSLRKDTDYVSFTVIVNPQSGPATTHTLTKAMGDVDNGTHTVNLTFSNVVLKPTDSVVLSYLIVNTGAKGSGTVDTIENALKTAAVSLATKGLSVGGAALGGAIGSIVPGLGTLIGLGVGAIGGWAVGELKGFLSANCDGLVAAEKVNLAYQNMVVKTAQGTFSQTTHHPGLESAQGCGYNSSYNVTWTVQSHP